MFIFHYSLLIAIAILIETDCGILFHTFFVATQPLSDIHPGYIMQVTVFLSLSGVHELLSQFILKCFYRFQLLKTS